jgi:hypothetical protein
VKTVASFTVKLKRGSGRQHEEGAFRVVANGLAAAARPVAMDRSLSHRWPSGSEERVRTGLHAAAARIKEAGRPALGLIDDSLALA